MKPSSLSGALLLAGSLLVPMSVQAMPAPDDVLSGLTCSGDAIPHDEVIGALLKASGLAINGRVLAAFADGKLGNEVVDWRNDPDFDTASPARSLSDETEALLARGAGGSDPKVIVSSGAPQDLDRLLLNRNAAGLVRFPCVPAPTPSTGAGTETADGDASAWRDALILTSTADAGRTESLKSRPFGTFSYLENFGDDETVAAADLYLGFSRGIWFHGAVSPSLSYQRRSGSEPQNDLAFALEGAATRLSWSAGYETDDGFDSVLYRAALEYRPLRGPNPCAQRWVVTDARGLPRSGGRCDLWLVADYVDVADPGDKEGLVDKREFGRTGLRVGASWWTRIGESEAYWLVTGSYSLFETLSGDEADAGMTKLSLEYVPSDESLYSFGVTYERGEDPTSFTDIDQLKFTLGVRR